MVSCLQSHPSLGPGPKVGVIGKRQVILRARIICGENTHQLPTPCRSCTSTILVTAILEVVRDQLEFQKCKITSHAI